jgi:RNA polymerase sigma-70 factor (ECF subfamily)
MTEQSIAAAQAGLPAEHTVRVQQLFVRHQSAVKAFILALRPNFDDAEDVLQETFLTVTRKASEFHDGSNFIAWAFAIARFKVFEARRQRPAGHAELSEDVLGTLAAAAPDETFFEARLAALHRCLDRLAPRAREIVRLRYQDDHGPEAIARQLAWTPNAVNVALSRARAALRHCLRHQLKKA